MGVAGIDAALQEPARRRSAISPNACSRRTQRRRALRLRSRPGACDRRPPSSHRTACFVRQQGGPMRRTILEQFLRDDRPTWQRWAMVVVGFLLLLLAPLIAHAQGGGPDTLQIVWTATGDDGAIGTAASYQIRVSTAPITLANWGAANVVGPAPLPLPSGSRQGFTVRGLSSDTTYYIAMISADETGNTSSLSNVLRWDWSADAS